MNQSNRINSSLTKLMAIYVVKQTAVQMVVQTLTRALHRWSKQIFMTAFSLNITVSLIFYISFITEWALRIAHRPLRPVQCCPWDRPPLVSRVRLFIANHNHYCKKRIIVSDLCRLSRLTIDCRQHIQQINSLFSYFSDKTEDERTISQTQSSFDTSF